MNTPQTMALLSWFWQGTRLNQIDGLFRSHGPIQLTLQRIQQQIHLATNVWQALAPKLQVVNYLASLMGLITDPYLGIL